MNNYIKIEEKTKTYSIKTTYHSDMTCQNYDAELEAILESDGKISFRTANGSKIFEFTKSDPDRVFAIASMIKAFARKVKKTPQKSIDISATA